jgi:response regulator RpfG family c-di-GMP phosphodiesterase
MNVGAATILIVDDTESLRDMLSMRLELMGYHVLTAEHGLQALVVLGAHPVDLILLDIMMPEMSGYEVLEHLKANNTLRHIPVIVISAISEMDSVARCIELGAEDHLHKPINAVLLRARISAGLEKKRLRDQEQAYLQLVQEERKKSDSLLLNILPAPVAERLKAGEPIVADGFENVTVMFADIVDFTHQAMGISPHELVQHLNEIFSVFDELAERHGLEKIKTIGDAYMLVGGLPTPRSDHAEAVVEAALDMLACSANLKLVEELPLSLRIGIDSGPVVAGVIGRHKFADGECNTLPSMKRRVPAISRF